MELGGFGGAAMKNWLVGFSALLALGGCVSADLFAAQYYVLPPEQVAELTTGGKGAIIVDMNTDAPCSTLELRYRDLDTGAVWRRTIVRTYTEYQIDSIDAGGLPTIIVLPVGNYAFAGGSCFYATGSYSYGITEYTLSLDDLSLWLAPFTIRAGEIVYTGTAVPELLSYQWGAQPGVFSRVMGLARSADSYNLFEVVDRSEHVRGALQNYNPGLVSRLVSRVSPARIDKEVARNIVDSAYQEAVRVTPATPGDAERAAVAARERVDAGLRAHLAERSQQAAP